MKQSSPPSQQPFWQSYAARRVEQLTADENLRTMVYEAAMGVMPEPTGQGRPTVTAPRFADPPWAASWTCAKVDLFLKEVFEAEWCRKWLRYLETDAAWVRRERISQSDLGDLISETLQAHLTRPDYMEKSARETERLLRVVFSSKSCDSYRRASRERPLTESEAAELRSPAVVEQLVRQEERNLNDERWRELVDMIWGAADRIRSRKQREALDAYLGWNRTYARTALALGRTEAAVTQQVHSAVRAILANLPRALRRMLPEARTMQLTVRTGSGSRMRALLHLIELLSKRARSELKLVIEEEVQERIAARPAHEREAITAWIGLGCDRHELPDPIHAAADAGLESIVAELRTTQPEWISLASGAFKRDRRRAQARVATRPKIGPGAHTPLFHWVLGQLLPRLIGG
ncbi:MAG: sigma-70 family RNA polymerase sigma factor [bacterium]|nr:sigma-70 family RNA polymerase sigma factor [bacterium]